MASIFSSIKSPVSNQEIMEHLTLKSIYKTYPNGVEAVKRFNLTVSNGEFIVLIGPSGCGKTSTLRMICGLESPSGGDILINGRRINELAPKQRDMVMVFQNYTLFPHMSVHNNISFPLRLLKHNKKSINSK